MATLASHNTNNASVKRILREARQIQEDPSTEFVGGPLEDNLFDWHCTLRGPKDTEFEGGLYHVRITLPPTYPFRPPSLRVLTPSGRFETDTPICISFTNYHEELWQPAWGIRTAVIGLQGFFSQSGTSAMGVGALNAPVQQRKRLAMLSRDWKCPHCKMTNLELLPDAPTSEEGNGSKDAAEVQDEPKEQTENAQVQSQTNAPEDLATQPSSHLAPSLPNNVLLVPSVPITQSTDNTPPINSPTPGIPTLPALTPTPTTPLPPTNDKTNNHSQPVNATTPHQSAGQSALNDHPQQHQQLQMQAFPSFRNSATEGVPLWLDSAILILSVLLGGIMIHRVMF